jgi:phenylalanyl-tRNA synthetase beta chain
MKLSIKEARKYTDINFSLEELANVIATKIGEVESIQDWKEIYSGITVAEIVTKEEHPDADKLGIYEINKGDEQTIQVVAGDKTLEVGDKVAYIEPGMIVPSTYKTAEEFQIKAIKVRGILSNGMLCSEKELNIGPDHSTVLKLESEAKVGLSFVNYFEFDDVVINIENKALTNRGDLFGILGLARELSAAQSKPFKSPDWYKEHTLNYKKEIDSLPLEINNQSTNLCPRYMGVAIDSVEVKESPVWLKSLLLRVGIKPINNIVDITNYISILTGQPLHAFDYDKVVKNDPHTDGKAHITIRLAQDNETIHTLDNSVVDLNSNVLVIADSTNPIAIAGVIGGLDTEIDTNTKRVIFECANFDRFNIRKTSMSLGIITDAVTRYTRAQDPNQCLPALNYALSLVKELSGGQIASNIIDNYPNVYTPKQVTLSISKLNTHLGTSLTREEVSTILQNIEYEISSNKESEDFLTVTAPTFRTDILIPEDIHEDIGRIYGYENIKPTLPLRDISPAKKNRGLELKRTLRNVLSNSGLNEIITYNFVSKALIEKAKQDPNIAYHIRNAQSPELSLMRPSLLVSMLQKAQENSQRNISTFGMYEFNISHQKGYMDKFELPKEDWHMSILFSTKENIFDGNPYYQVKRYFEKLHIEEGIEYILLNNYSETNLPIWIKNLIPTFNSNATVLIIAKLNGKEEIVGIMGEIDTEVKENFKLPTYTSALEINLEVLKMIENSKKKYSENSRYPSITQDVCFTVDSGMLYSELEKIIKSTINTKMSKASVECIDIYQKKEGSKNITVRITIEHQSKTLTDKEFTKLTEKILKRISK